MSVSVSVSVFRLRFTSRRRRSELASDLGRDLRVRLLAHDVAQRVLLLRGEVRRIALAEHEQALVPEHGQRSGRVCVGEPDKMKDERVEHLVRQRVLLVEQDADEERCWPCVHTRAYVGVCTGE